MEGSPRCPVCNVPLEEDKDAGYRIPPRCPYETTGYPELCALHDKLYFGKWRKMEAEPGDIRRGYRKLGRLLAMLKGIVEREKVEAADANLRNAEEALSRTDADGDPFSSVKHMDQALSYIHHALNDLLRANRSRPHSPADYEKYYDVILPFKEDW